MNNINVYYCIVPISDGYHYVCQNKNTQELYLCHKALDDNYVKKEYYGIGE